MKSFPLIHIKAKSFNVQSQLFSSFVSRIKCPLNSSASRIPVSSLLPEDPQPRLHSHHNTKVFTQDPKFLHTTPFHSASPFSFSSSSSSPSHPSLRVSRLFSQRMQKAERPPSFTGTQYTLFNYRCVPIEPAWNRSSLLHFKHSWKTWLIQSNLCLSSRTGGNNNNTRNSYFLF